MDEIRAQVKWLCQEGYDLRTIEQWAAGAILYDQIISIRYNRAFKNLVPVKPTVLPITKKWAKTRAPSLKYYSLEFLQNIKWLINKYDYQAIKRWADINHDTVISSDTLWKIKNGKSYKAVDAVKPAVLPDSAAPRRAPEHEEHWMVFKEVARLRRYGANEQYIKWHTGVGM